MIFLFLIQNTTFSQTTSPSYYDMQYDDSLKPQYYKHQIIVSFDPSLIKTEKIDDKDFQKGVLKDFIKDEMIQFLLNSGYWNKNIADYPTEKIFDNMVSTDTSSITRLGDTIDNGKPWSTILIFWDLNDTTAIQTICDSINTFYPYVHFSHPNYILKALGTSANDPFYTSEQASLAGTSLFPYGNINIEGAWDYATGKDYIKVGIEDAGIKTTHEDFNNGSFNQIKGGRNYYPFGTLTDDLDGHGTACAGIIGALRNNKDNNGNYIGIAGIAGGNFDLNNKGVSLWNQKVLKGNLGDAANIANGIREASDISTTSYYGFGMHILNNSYGGPFNPIYFPPSNLNDRGIIATEVKNAFRNKVIFVATRGTDGINNAIYPANFRDDWVISVGGSDQDGNKASISSYGSNMDLIAPSTGNIIYTLNYGVGYTHYSNSSMGCAHTTGVAALMLSYLNSSNNNDPSNLAPEDVEFLLQKYATPKGGAVPNSLNGYGLLNAANVFNHLDLSHYHIRHYSANGSTSGATIISPSGGSTITLAQPAGGLAAGVPYKADVYKKQTTYSYTLPSGTTIIDAWVRNSSSNLFDASNPLVTEPNVNIVSYNNSSITIEGYIYHFTYNPSTGQSIDVWLPYTNYTANFAFTLHTYELYPTGVDNKIKASQISLYPNPTSKLLKVECETKIDVVQITDLSGQIVKSIVLTNTKKTCAIDVAELEEGIYIVSVMAGQGIIKREILIQHE